MGLAVFFLLLILVVLVGIAAVVITGIVFIVIGSKQKKKGGKGTLRIVGIVLVCLPSAFALGVTGKIVIGQLTARCLADKWRNNPYMSDSGSTASRDMLRAMFEYVDDNDEETFCREFSADVRDDRHFEDTVDDFFDDLEDLDVELDPDVFLETFGDRVHLDLDSRDSGYPFIEGYINSAEIDGETYYCYIRICYKSNDHKEDVGLQQFIVCTEDKYDELNQIIEDGDNDIYLAVL